LTLILEYERIRNKSSKRYFKRVKDLERFSGQKRKVIWQWYQKFIKSDRNSESLLPVKRAPKNPYGKPQKN